MTEIKNQEGLPQIANLTKQIHWGWVTTMILPLGMVGFLILHTVTPKSNSTPIDETFHRVIDTVPTPPSPLPTNASQPKGPSTNHPMTLNLEQEKLLQAKQLELQQRLQAPLMLVNNNQKQNDPTTSTKNSSSKTGESPQATVLGDRHTLISQGNIIHAILETAIQSDLPGMLRAIVSEPVYSDDGTAVLIPQGSRLMGEYKSGMAQGQTRILVVWTRLITPEDIAITLNSPGVDPLGMAGMPADNINTHFFARFGEATLFSILSAGASNVGVSNNTNYNAAQAYRLGVADNLAQSASQSLQATSPLGPTLTINQGNPILVFVARDLNFKHAFSETKQVSIF